MEKGFPYSLEQRHFDMGRPCHISGISMRAGQQIGFGMVMLISVIYAWIKWVFMTRSWGSICFILCLRPYFSYYTCFGLFGIFAFRFTYIEPSNGRKG